MINCLFSGIEPLTTRKHSRKPANKFYYLPRPVNRFFRFPFGYLTFRFSVSTNFPLSSIGARFSSY